MEHTEGGVGRVLEGKGMDMREAWKAINHTGRPAVARLGERHTIMRAEQSVRIGHRQ